MLKNAPFYAGFSVDDINAAREFYATKLGVEVIDVGMGGLIALRAGNGYSVLVYPKPNHEPATYTVLNFPVDDVEATVDRLTAAGVTFEQYDYEQLKTDAKGIARPMQDEGPTQAWFKDPAGNILSILSD